MENSKDNSNNNEEFEKLLDDSFNEHLTNESKVQPGALVHGTVIKVTSDAIYLNIGLKTEGFIALNEFKDTETLPKEGDVIEALVSRRTPETVYLSFSKAQGIKAAEELKLAHKENLAVTAKITEVVNKGFIAMIDKTIRAFVPMSQIDVVHVSENELQQYVGNTYDFLIISLTLGKYYNIVLSRKELLQNIENVKKELFFKSHQEGDIVKGIVKNYAPFGVFIDLGGFDGLLHVSDLSWGKNLKLSELAPKNSELDLKIIKLDQEQNKINLSLKALKDNPWNTIDDTLQPGTIVEGKVVKVLPYGIFVYIEDGIEGFIHISDMSWVKRVNHPNEIVKINTSIKCKILSIDKEQQRLSLGLKQLEENPWDSKEVIHPIGTKYNLPIQKLLKSGITIEFEDGIKGFISKDDFSWNKYDNIHFNVDDIVECVVTGYNDKNKEVLLSIKQLEENAWTKKGFHIGDVVEGRISKITDFGIFLIIDSDVEGLIPKFQAYDPSEHSSYEEAIKHISENDVLQAIIKKIDVENQKMILSIREHKESDTKKELKKHLFEGHESHSMNIGDIISQSENDTSE